MQEKGNDDNADAVDGTAEAEDRENIIIYLLFNVKRVIATCLERHLLHPCLRSFMY